MPEEPLFQSFLRSISMQLRARSCQLYRITEAGVDMAAQVGRRREPSLADHELSARAADTGLLQVAQEPEPSGLEFPQVPSRPRRLSIALPVKLGGAVVGVLVAHSIPAQSLQAIEAMIPRLGL